MRDCLAPGFCEDRYGDGSFGCLLGGSDTVVAHHLPYSFFCPPENSREPFPCDILMHTESQTVIPARLSQMFSSPSRSSDVSVVGQVEEA